MAPVEALLLTTFIICYLLYDDWKRRPNVSYALWIPLIWMMITGSRMLSHWFSGGTVEISTDAYAYLEGSPFDRIVFIMLIIAAGITLLRRNVEWGEVLGRNKWIVLLVLYSFISIAWSDFPDVSLKRWIKMIGVFLMTLVVFTEDDPVEALRTLGRRCAFILIPMSLTLYKYFPGMGRGYHPYTGELSILGVTNSKNSLGALCLVCGLFLIWELWTRKDSKNTKFSTNKFAIIFLIFPILFWLLYKANSATAIACFIIGIFTFYIMKRVTQRNKTFLGFVLIEGILIVAGLEYLFDGLGFYVLELGTKLLGRDLTFTGRTDLWNDLMSMAGSPMSGYGYGSFWLGERMEKMWQMYWWHPNEAHNGFIEIYLDLGIIGVIILGGIIISAFRSKMKEVDENMTLMSLRWTLLIVSIMYNITESAFRPDLLLFFIFNLAIFQVPAKSNQRLRPTP